MSYMVCQMRFKLVTDYLDNYDKFFEKTSKVEFERTKLSKFSREELFNYLKDLGNATPHYGVVERLVPFLFDLYQTENLLIVVYTDVFLHDRKQLLLVNAKSAFNIFKQSFAVEYLKGDEEYATSYTYLKIGNYDFGVKTTSSVQQCWQSNVFSKSTIMCRGEENTYNPKIQYPLYTIDYIQHNKKMFAVDFNVAPTLEETDIHLFMNDLEIFEAVAKAAENFYYTA